MITYMTNLNELVVRNLETNFVIYIYIIIKTLSVAQGFTDSPNFSSSKNPPTF